MSIRERIRLRQEEAKSRKKWFNCDICQVLCILATGVFFITSFIAASKIYNAAKKEELAIEARIMKESSMERLRRQKIDDGDIFYVISKGELKIYQKTLDYREKLGRLGPAIIKTKVPCVKAVLIKTINIPRYEGKLDPKIMKLEKDDGIFDLQGNLMLND